jgi:hypothetical protein
MGYALMKDGSGFRAVNSQTDVNATTETYSDTQPVLVLPPQPDPVGFTAAVKAAVGGILAANALMIAYPAFFPAIQSADWADVQALVIDAKAKAVITAAQYTAIKAAAAASNIPVTL